MPWITAEVGPRVSVGVSVGSVVVCVGSLMRIALSGFGTVLTNLNRTFVRSEAATMARFVGRTLPAWTRNLNVPSEPTVVLANI